MVLLSLSIDNQFLHIKIKDYNKHGYTSLSRRDDSTGSQIISFSEFQPLQSF